MIDTKQILGILFSALILFGLALFTTNEPIQNSPTTTTSDEQRYQR